MARKPRSRVSLAHALWFACGANVAAGILLSPLTSVRVVRVTGCAREHEGQVSRALQGLQGWPWVLAPKDSAQSHVLGLPAIKSCQYDQNIFGRGRLSLTYRTAVAFSDRDPLLALSEEGEWFRVSKADKGLPHVSFASEDGSLSPGFISRTPTKTVAKLCKWSKKTCPNVPTVIAIDGRGVLSLRIGKEPTIVFGSVSEIDKKTKRLETLLTENKDLLKSVRSINVTAPDAPVIVKS